VIVTDTPGAAFGEVLGCVPCPFDAPGKSANMAHNSANPRVTIIASLSGSRVSMSNMPLFAT
jgi:hypothetical protein